MKKGYIPKNQRKKILLLSDDIRNSSCVGTMSKEIKKDYKVYKKDEVIEEKVITKQPELENPKYVSPWGNPGGKKK